MYNPYSLFSGKTILIVDDGSISKSIIRVLLEHNGVHVLIAENAADALGKFCKNPEFSISAILINLTMSLVDGYDVCSKIRHSGRSDSEIVPVIALITNSEETYKQKSIELGITDFLTRPIEPEKVLRTLSLYVD